jgi:hypothetical protein
MSFEFHHLIPTSLQNHPVFLALANDPSSRAYNRFTLRLPNKDSAARAAQVVTAPPLDGVHQGGHYAAYTESVRRYLDIFQSKHLNSSGAIEPGQGDALVKNLQRLEMRLADILTASQVPDGHGGFRTVDPQGALNAADPRIDSETTAERMRQFWRNLRDGAIADIDSPEFRQLDKGHHLLDMLNERDLADVTSGTAGQRSAAIKHLIADEAGLESWGSKRFAALGDAGRRKIADALAEMRRNGDWQKLENAFRTFIGDERGEFSFSPDAAGQALKRMVDKVGRVETIALGIVGLSLYQIASEYDIGVTDLLAELGVQLSPEMMEDLATGIIRMAFETAVLTFATGGIGTVLTLAVVANEAYESLETLRLALDLYRIAFPDGVLADIIEGVLPSEVGKGTGFARAHINNSSVLGFLGIDFAAFDKAQSVVVADDAGVAEIEQGKLSAKGTKPGDFVFKATDQQGVVQAIAVDGTDIMWGRGGAKIYGLGGGDLLLHTGYGEAHGGDGNDVVIGQNTRFVKAGEAFDLTEMLAYEARRAQNLSLAALGLPTLPDLPVPAKAYRDYQVLLDGAAGNDVVLALKGEGEDSLGELHSKVTTIGGLGRDWIYNTSAGGIIWGDVANSITRDDGSRFAIVDGQTVEIADDASNADNFWFAGGTTIMDAQKSDVLKFFGVTLTGGEVGASAWSLFAGARTGSLLVAMANDNSSNAWPERAFHFVGREMVA